MRNSLAIFFSFFILVANAQLTTTHPLSSYGIGEYNAGSNAISSALGFVNASMIDSGFVNYYNPSSYSRLSKGNTLLSLGIDSRFSMYSQGGVSENKIGSTVDHFSLGLKMNKLMGMSFGLKPYSKVGYEFSENVYTGVDSLRYTYTGTGSLQDVYLGFAISPIQTANSHLSIGFNTSYLFGYVSNDRKSELLNGSTDQGGLSKDITRLSAFHYELGAHFQQNIGSRHKLLIGFIFDPSQRFNATLDNELYTASNINAPEIYDTISYSRMNGFVEVLSVYELGIKYQIFFKETKRKSNTRRPNLTLFASYKKWNGIQSDFETPSSNWEIGKADKWSIGMSYSPETKLFENVATLKAFEKLNYRIGVYQMNMPFSSNGINYVDRGTTFGFGIPILAQMSLSSLNFAFVLGQKGNGNESGLKENYLGFNFGMVFSPSAFEKWFRKRKLD